MTQKQYKLFCEIARLNQFDLKSSLDVLLSKRYPGRVVNKGEYLYAEGDIPVCLIAHMDTVHLTPAKDIYYDKDSKVLWSPQGIGADDRAGVYSILHILKDGYRPHVIFTTNEETGCLGASALAREVPECPFDDCHFLIELDRHDKNDCVFYEFEDEKFEKFIEEYGFHTEWGSYTDICEIAPRWDIAAVNLSIGYEREHTLTEVLHTDWMFETIKKVEKLLSDARNGKTKRYEFKYGRIPLMYSKYYGKYYDMEDDYYYSTNLYMKPKKKDNRVMCFWCMNLIDSKDAVTIRTKDGYEDCYCKTCYEKAKKFFVKEERIDV